MIPVPADPRWLEILKASGWQTWALATAAGLLLYGNSKKLLPVTLEPWQLQAATAVFVICGCLWLASVGASLVKAAQAPRAKIGQLWVISRAKRQIAKAIPELLPREREIIAYLLAKNQSLFTNTVDCGHACTLVSKRIVDRALVPGQVAHPSDVPFEVPPHVWEILMKHKSEFPYKTPKAGETEIHPWRVHWMAR
jgi:hypothetical protein